MRTNSLRKLSLVYLVQNPQILALAQSAGRLFQLQSLAFSEKAAKKLSSNPKLFDGAQQNNLSDELLAQHGLRSAVLHIEQSEVRLIVAGEEAGKEAFIFFNGEIYQADIPIPTKETSSPSIAPPGQARTSVIPPRIEADFIQEFSETPKIIAQHLAAGTLVAMIGRPSFDQRLIEPLTKELEKLGLDQEQIKSRIEEFRYFYISPQNGKSTTESILDSQENLSALKEKSIQGRNVVVLAAEYEFINQWLLCNLDKALSLNSTQRRILIEAGEFEQFEKGSHRSDGGKLILVLEELIAEERSKHKSQNPRENMAAAFCALRENIFSSLSDILNELEETASLPNGYLQVYQTARQRLLDEADFLAKEAEDAKSLYVKIENNTIVIKLPWRNGVRGIPSISRRAIYEFIEQYNRGKPEKDHLHIAISYDRERRLGHEYLIGVNPNSYLAGEINLSNLWEALATEENKQRKGQHIPAPSKNWGGHPAAGGSPISSRGTVLPLGSILAAIGRLPVIENVRSGLAMYRNHSLNLPEYLVPRIPSEALEALDKGDFVSVELHHGPLGSAQNYLGTLRSELEELEKVATKDGVKQHWYRRRGTNQFIVANILGDTKLEHMRLYLTYAGLCVEKIYHYFGDRDYLAAAQSLVQAARKANKGQFPKKVVVGPSGTLGFIAADRLSAQSTLIGLQKSGGRGKVLVAKLKSDFEAAVSSKLRALAENLEYEQFCKNNPRIPEANRKKAYEGRLRQAVALLESFGVKTEGINDKSSLETLEAQRQVIISKLNTLAPTISERLFGEYNLAAALEKSPEEVVTSDKHTKTLLGFRKQAQSIFGVLKIKKAPFDIGASIKAEKIKTRVPNEVFQAHILRIPGKEPALLVNIPFGRLAEHLALALPKEDLEHVMFFGNGGFITNGNPKQEAVEVGDLFIPATMLSEKGEAEGFENQALSLARGAGRSVIDMTGDKDQAGNGEINLVLTRHAGHVVSPLQEHDAYVENLQTRKSSSVELEMGPLIKGLGNSVKVSLIGYFSDIPGKEGETLADASLGGNPRILRAKSEMTSYLLRTI